MSTSNTQSNEMSSELQNFYRNKTVFITGGSGFMGIVLIEKLLRSTEVKRIYLLFRPKRDKSVEERLASLFESALFDKLKTTCDSPTDLVKTILGDCNMANFGISPEDRKVLIEEVNIVIHLAATVRFNEPLYRAVDINVRATLDLLQLAKEMRQLKAFVHVSSAFANCYTHEIDEKYYNKKLSISAVKMCDLAKTLGFETTNKLEDALCKEYQNTYTFTKSLAEEAVLSEGRTLPISIFRPAIVAQTYHEPITGWVGNLYGPSAALYACGRGVLRVMLMKANHETFLVPADYCANLMLAIGWETAKRSQKERLTVAPPIYNYANDKENPFTWKDYISIIADYGYEVTLTKMIWYPFMTTASQMWLYHIMAFFLHTLPGYLLDFLLVLQGKKRRMIELYRKVNRQTKAMEYFITNEFKFTYDNTQALWDSLSPRDKEIFQFDLRSIYWKEYMQSTLRGMRLYLGRETPDTLPKAQIKYKRLRILHQFTKAIAYGIIIYIIWILVKNVF